MIPAACYETFCVPTAGLSLSTGGSLCVPKWPLVTTADQKKACCCQNYSRPQLRATLLSQGKQAVSCWPATAIHPALRRAPDSSLPWANCSACSQVLAKNGSWEQATTLVRLLHLTHSSPAPNRKAGKPGNPSLARPLLPLLIPQQERSLAGLVGPVACVSPPWGVGTAVPLCWLGDTTPCLQSRGKITVDSPRRYSWWVHQPLPGERFSSSAARPS